jgi:hypothetical protein
VVGLKASQARAGWFHPIAPMNTSNAELRTQSAETPAWETFVTIGGVDYSVKCKPGEGGERGYYWVTVSAYEPELKWWRMVISESANDCADEMEAIKDAFKHQRDRMKSWVRSWVTYRQDAAQEKGGKRAYYTKWANKSLKIALEYAPKWKLAKQLWKEITRL